MTVTEQPIGNAVLYVSSNVRPEVHGAFSEWCDSIHHFDTMRIEGFLSLRRFEFVKGSVAAGVKEFGLLTLYQVADAQNADFSTPAYQEHTATYTPPPEGVTDGIEYERHVLMRAQRPAPGTTQSVGEACISVVGQPGAWLDDVMATVGRCDGVLGAHRVDGEDRSIVLIDLENVDDGDAALAALDAIPDEGRRGAVQLFRQVFPESGVLVRDREILAGG
jgi:hypothetical protein